jgi:acetyltransferase-like isoleucine patch superfamily enzyme
MKEFEASYFLKNPSRYRKFFTVDGFRSHVFPMLWACWCLRRATHLGQGARVWGRPSLRLGGTCWIGDRVRLVSTIATTEVVVKRGGLLEILDGTYINYGCSIAVTNRLRIGTQCRIGPYVMISDNQFHCLEPDRRDELPESEPVTLEDNIWLGARVIVLPGVTIGMNSVIGAGSVVSRDIPPNSVAAGVPAKVIKKLSVCLDGVGC